MSATTCVLCGSSNLRPGRAGLTVCVECGLAGAYPLPAPAELAALYARGYYEAWGPDGGEDPLVGSMKRATFEPRLRRLPPLPPAARILDVGCATGWFLDVAADLGADPYGVELSAYAARVAGERHPGRVTEGTLADARFPDDHFFAVFLSDVIEHVPDPDRLLAQCHRVLEPGGWVVISTPDFGGLSARLLGRRWFHRKTEHLLYFTRRSLRRALGQAGFVSICIRRGFKAMTVRYLASQFRTYRLFPATPVLSVLDRVLPDRLRRGVFSLPSGEIVAYARKPGRTGACEAGGGGW